MSTILVVDDSPTIRRVVSTILENHGFDVTLAVDGQDAMEALKAGEARADLVLLDFVMPRMNGFQFCRALRADTDLTHMPIVLMSAKSDKIREQFVQQTGAIDAISKPFDADALVAVVENALRRVQSGRASASALAELVDDDDDDVDVVPPTKIDDVTAAAKAVGALVARAAGEGVRAAKDDAALVDAVGRGIDLPLLGELADVVNPALAKAGKAPALSGDLAVVPIGAVLQMLQVEGQTGLLSCSLADRRIDAQFRGGLIDLVQSRGGGEEFRIGRYFVELGVLTADDVEQVAKAPAPPKMGDDAPASTVHAKDTPTPLGLKLLAAGRIDDEQLRAALVQQSSEIVYELLRWTKGRFTFQRRVPDELAEKAKLGLPVAQVVMEGFRRVDEWRVLETTLGSFESVLVRDQSAIDAMGAKDLPRAELTVLEAIDGERTIREVIARCHMSSFDVCRALVQFLAARVVRRRSAP